MVKKHLNILTSLAHTIYFRAIGQI